MTNDYASIITAGATVVLVIATTVYVILTHNILKQSKTDTKIAYTRNRLEKYYIPLSSFFDLCETDECFNCNPEDLPTKVSFDSSDLELFKKIHQYQYLACPKLKSKMGEFVLMLINQHSDEKEEAMYSLFNQIKEDGQILTIKYKSDLKQFVEIREFVVQDIERLMQKLDKLIE